MKKININILEGACPMCGGHHGKTACPDAHNGEEARMHRTTLAHLMADTKVLLDMIQDEDDLPEWLETKITKAGDYMSSAARYIAGNEARNQGQLEEKKNCGCNQDPCITFGEKPIQEEILDEGVCEVDMYHELYEQLQDAIDEDGGSPCPECLYEMMVDASCGCSELVSEAKYKGRTVKLNKRMRGDVKKFKVFVRGCGKKKDTIRKINFGDKNMKIKKNIPGRRKSFRARHKCHTAKDKCTARYWSCKAW